MQYCIWLSIIFNLNRLHSNPEVYKQIMVHSTDTYLKWFLSIKAETLINAYYALLNKLIGDNQFIYLFM